MAPIRAIRDRQLFSVAHTSRLPPETGTGHGDGEGGHFVDKEGISVLSWEVWRDCDGGIMSGRSSKGRLLRSILVG